jgi:hypothetical protein
MAAAGGPFAIATKLTLAQLTCDEARWIVIPTERFEDAFFQLRTRIAGEIIGKFAVYKMRVAIVGDISRHTEGSSAFQAFVYECNRGDQVWFVANIEEFNLRLERPHAAASD